MSFKASVPETASTEVYEVHWAGEFDNERFVQGNDYTITVKLRIKASSSNNFAASSQINATINGKKAQVTGTSDANRAKEKTITVKYTWKTLGGENPNNPKTKLKTRLSALAAEYKANNATDHKDLLAYLKKKLPDAEIWLGGGAYASTPDLRRTIKNCLFSSEKRQRKTATAKRGLAHLLSHPRKRVVKTQKTIVFLRQVSRLTTPCMRSSHTCPLLSHLSTMKRGKALLRLRG